jgi:glutamine synthetase
VNELARFLEVNGELEAVEAFITDPNGVARGKLLRTSELAALYRTGRPLPGSILSMDITGVEVERTSGDPDKLARPVPGSLRRASWRSVPTAQVLLSLWEPDGTPHVADPRHVLANVVAKLEAEGYVPVVAAELEFYVVDPTRGSDPQLRPPCTRNGRRLAQIDMFSVTELEELAPFVDDLFAAARVMQLPAESIISEYGPGQLEVVLRHRADALRAADDAIQWKRLVRGVATNTTSWRPSWPSRSASTPAVASTFTRVSKIEAAPTSSLRTRRSCTTPSGACLRPSTRVWACSRRTRIRIAGSRQTATHRSRERGA